MKPRYFVNFLMISMIMVSIKQVSARPTNTAKEMQLALRKRFETETDIAKLRNCIYKLEQVEKYYKQLFIRGYLSETDIRQLERLQQFINKLKSNVQALLKPEQQS